MTVVLLFLLALCILIVATWLFLQHPQFGSLPKGRRLQRIQDSPYYQDGAFRNIQKTAVMPEGVSMWSMVRNVLLKRAYDLRPTQPLPSERPDLHSLPRDRDLIVWFGHSSYFLQLKGKRILVDPVFSGSISPLPGMNRSFNGSEVVRPGDIPDLDVLVLTHDHWDHLDYHSVKELVQRSNKVLTSLGVGEHLERWGCRPDQLVELEWWESVTLLDTMEFSCVPGRHFSGRLLRRAQSLWSGFALRMGETNILLGGDSGYGDHFQSIGEKLGPFDLVILESGQYNTHWRNIHMMPEQTVQAAQDLGAKRLFPVHWAKFVLARHPWYEPIERVVAAANQSNMPLMHPRIGEIVDLWNPLNSEWWSGVRVAHS